MIAALSLARREWVRFFRQRSRIIGGLGTPLLFWGLIGSGLDSLAWLFPGTLLMIVLFTSIFSTISIIEDRREGFLQGVLVSPVPRAAIVLGKVLGGGAVAWAQGLLFLALSPVAGVWPGPVRALAAAGVLAILAFGLTSLGALLAWRFESVQGFHSVMNLLLIPMWLLSGGVFKPEATTGWMKAVTAANPLSYGVEAIRGLLAGEGTPLGVPVAVTAGFAAAVFAAAALAAGRGRR